MAQSIYWVNHSPSPYMASLFRALSNLRDIDLHVHHVVPAWPGHPWRTSLTDGYRQRAFETRLGVDWRMIEVLIRDKNAYFIMGCWGVLTNQICIFLSILLRRRYALFNDTPDVERRRNPVKAAIRSIFLRAAFRGARTVFGTGQPALDVMEKMGCPKGKLVNLPHFSEPGEFRRRSKWYEGKPPIVIVSAGRLAPEKGFPVGLEALARVFRDKPMDFRYRIMGTGPEAERLLQHANRLGIGGSVEFLGWLEPSVARVVFEEGDLFLHPSLFEPYGVAVVEAMAAGLVVVASDKTCAALDRIKDRVNGILFETNNVTQLAGIIQSLCDHPEWIRSLSVQARSTAEEWPLARGVEIIRAVSRPCNA